MKKINKLMVMGIVLMGFVWGCSQGKYDDMMEMNDQYVSVTQKYIDSVNKAETSEDIAAAMNQYADEFKKLGPKMKELHKQYPDLMNAKDLPEKIKQSQAKATQIGMDLASSFMKTMKYMTDPQVVKAQKRMTEVMQSMQQ